MNAVQTMTARMELAAMEGRAIALLERANDEGTHTEQKDASDWLTLVRIVAMLLESTTAYKSDGTGNVPG